MSVLDGPWVSYFLFFDGKQQLRASRKWRGQGNHSIPVQRHVRRLCLAPHSDIYLIASQRRVDVSPLRRTQRPCLAIHLLPVQVTFFREPLVTGRADSSKDPETGGRSLEQMDILFSDPSIFVHHQSAKLDTIERLDPDLYHGLSSVDILE